MYAGWDVHYGYQLYQSDPSGNYGGWKASAIGANHAAATSILRTEWKEDLTLRDALKLAIKVMSKTMDTTITSEKCKQMNWSLFDGFSSGYFLLNQKLAGKISLRATRNFFARQIVQRSPRSCRKRAEILRRKKKEKEEFLDLCCRHDIQMKIYWVYTENRKHVQSLQYCPHFL